MKQLLAGPDAIQRIVGPQKIRAEAPYRESRFVVHVPCTEGELLYNTLTGVLFLLESGERAEAHRERLIEARFWVPVDTDEGAYCDSVRRICRLLHVEKKNKTGFTILTTTDCNARCYYCYERGIPRLTMTETTAADVAAYIARVSGGEEVALNWFGGEPLYNRRAIDVVCGRLRGLGIPYTSTMTSNGFYLDAATAATAKESWNLTNVQITLDGTRQIYARAKAYVDGGADPYGRVLDNIEAALDAGIEVSIRLNIDGGNADDLFRLAEELAARFGGRTGLHTYVQLLQEVAGRIDAFPSEQEAAQRCMALSDRLVALGLAKPPQLNRELIVNHCIADNDACEVIAPDGRICRCEHYKEDEFVGSIYSDARDQRRIDAWKEAVTFPECGDCPSYPRCSFLKKCDWSAKGCPESLRIVRMERLKRQIVTTYEGWKQQSMEDEG